MTTLKSFAALVPVLIAVSALAPSLTCCSSSDSGSGSAAKGAGAEALGDAATGQNEGHAGSATITDPNGY
jgi:hypothetical protein